MLSHASLRASDGLLAVVGTPWLVGLCLHLCLVFSLSVCLHPNFPLLEGHQSYWIRTHSTDLILTDYTGDSLISK